MAEIIRYVNTASTPGGDGTTSGTVGATRAYATITEWEAAEQTDLVAAGDRHTLICHGGALSDNFTVAGWTSNDTANYILMTVDSGSRHDGTPKSGFHISKSIGFTGIGVITQLGTIVEYFDFENLSGSGRGLEFSLASSRGIVNKCIVKGGADAIQLNGASNDVLVVNTIAYDSPIGIRGNNFTAGNVFNCTAINCSTTGITRKSTSGANKLIVKNCVTFDCTADYGTPLADYFDTVNSTHNAGETATTGDIPGGNSVGSIVAGDFTDNVNDDWSLAASSNLENVGSDLTTDFGAYDRTGYTLVEEDIMGNARPQGANWDIGAFERVAAGGGAALAGTPAVVSTLTGDLTVPADALIGSVTSVSTLSGDLSAPAALAGGMVSNCTLTGDLVVPAAGDIAGNMQAESTLTGDLTATLALGGNLTSSTTVTGNLTIPVILSGGMINVATMTGDLSSPASLAGGVTVVSTLQGGLTASTELICQLTARCTMTGNMIDFLEELLAMALRAQGRKKSDFPALDQIPSDATFDFVSGNTNYKIPITDFLTSLNVTGSIIQDGAVSGVPILDTQANVHNIRNIEPGPGISAAVSAENGIELKHNLSQGTGGVPVLTGLTDASPVINNIVGGTGITVTAIAGGIQISLT